MYNNDEIFDEIANYMIIIGLIMILIFITYWKIN